MANSSIGWLYSLKFHLVTNEHRELARLLTTPANNYYQVWKVCCRASATGTKDTSLSY
uniref:hypothetical protein n=1 Tax=Pontibacter pamirensis TaxID=2562824 RepID=UPI00138A31EA|nr:hypothetical protein [Pontibacter pamirensis]